MRIAIDAMGGDRGPDEVVAGACAAARDFGVEVLLVGDEAVIGNCIRRTHAARRSIRSSQAHPPSDSGGTGRSAAGALPRGVSVHPASQVVAMDEAPAQAHRKKPDSSVAVATRLHAEGRADAVLSAGNTGASVTEALFKLKRIAGIDRAGIASIFPTARKPLVLIDAGANVDCRPLHLAQFAIMGAAYARTAQNVIPGTGACVESGELPRVGLLSIGEEAGKGNELTKGAFKLVQDNAAVGNYQFHGNAEGRDIGLGTVDVVVCDGFVGNIALKVTEGFAKMVAGGLRTAFTSSPRAKAGALLLRPALRQFKQEIDYTEYGGAVLLGVNGVCVICHGSSDARSIYSAIRIARQTVAADVVGAIRATMENAPALTPKTAAEAETSAEAETPAAPQSAAAKTPLNGRARKSSGSKTSDIVPPAPF